MHLHEHDENSAPNEGQGIKPTDPEAHLAHGGADEGRLKLNQKNGFDLDVELESLGRIPHPVVRRVEPTR